MAAALERLVSFGIELVPMTGLERHFVLARGGFASLVEKTETGFGRAGTPGMVTGSGLMLLMWREGKPYFVAKGVEQEATPEQVEQLRSFAHDLEEALGSRG